MKYACRNICYILLVFWGATISCNKSKNSNNSGYSPTTADTTITVISYPYLYNNSGLAAVGDSVPFFGYLVLRTSNNSYYGPYSVHYSCYWNFGDGGSDIDTSALMPINANISKGGPFNCMDFPRILIIFTQHRVITPLT